MKCECVRPWMSALIHHDSVGICCWQIQPTGKLHETDKLHDVLIDYYRDFRVAMLEASKEDTLPEKYCMQHCRGKIDINCINNEELKEEISNGNVDVFMPLDISMTIDHDCNLSCKMCWIFNDISVKISEKFAVSSIDYIASLGYTDYKFTFLGGEPQYSIYEKTVIRYAIDKKILMYFISNFSIFDRITFDKMSIGQFKGLNISTNAASNETRKHIMGDSFDSFYTNVEKFLYWRNNRTIQGEISNVSMSFIIMTSNYHELIDVIDLALDLPVLLEFVPMLHKFDGFSEEIFTIKYLQDDVMLKINNALIHLDNMLITEDFKDTKIPCHAENIKDFKIYQINYTISSLNANLNCLKDIILNGPSFDAPLYDIEIKQKKINKIELI